MFDWITPLGGLLFPGTDIHIVDAPGYNGLSVLWLLRRHGIGVYFPQVTDEGVLVKVDDARRALKVLARHGVSAY